MGDANSSDGSYVQYNKYGDFYNFPRGYQRYNNDRLYSFKGDYIFPLWNPDFVIPGLMYFRRITTNLFYDYSWAEEDYKWTDTQQKGTFGAVFQSVGVELRSEIHVLRFLYQLTIGYRYAHLLTTNDNSSSLFLGLSFSGFAVGNR